VPEVCVVAVDEVCAVADEVCAAVDEVCAAVDEVCAAVDEVCAVVDEVCAVVDEVCAVVDEVCAADEVCVAAAAAVLLVADEDLPRGGALVEARDLCQAEAARLILELRSRCLDVIASTCTNG
jgi:hypothetical protein